MKKIFLATSALILCTLATGHATPVIMEGNYIRTAVSDDGTLGYGERTSPGLLYDPTGTGTFPPDDYLTPGTPWEIFSVKSDQSGIQTNNNTNTAGGAITGTLTDLSTTSIYDNHVSWSGTYNFYFDITTETYFNSGDERIYFSTVLTAAQDLTGVEFLRATDPDPDLTTFNSYNTINGRGYDSNGDGDYDDAGDVAPEDWVHAEGANTGLTLGLYTDSAYTHNTGISDFTWSTDPSFYLAGNNDGDGDHSIGLGFSIGELFQGDSATLTYEYVMGANLDDANPTDPVPEPATMVLFGTGMAGLMGVIRRKKK